MLLWDDCWEGSPNTFKEKIIKDELDNISNIYILNVYAPGFLFRLDENSSKARKIEFIFNDDIK